MTTIPVIYRQLNKEAGKGRRDLAPPVGQKLSRALAASGAVSIASPVFTDFMDEKDQLADLRDDFCFPTKNVVWPPKHNIERVAAGSREGGEDCVYMAGNSLGLMPKRVEDYVGEEIAAWSTRGVLGHTEHPQGNNWLTADEQVTTDLAGIVGAKPAEVACMGTLTANLHALLTSFYRPTSTRHKILYEGKAFPSDSYAFASQVAMHNFPPSSLLPIDPLEGEFSIRTSEILKVIEEQGEEIAVICFGAVQYYSGQWFDMEAITKAGHAKGCIVGFDCAHAVGNVPLALHDWGVDFACWCTYKYLNAGPGGIAGIFVHERWADRLHLAGWWGHDIKTRFDMPSTFSPIPGAAGWQLSNPSIFDIVALSASLRVFRKAAERIPSSLAGGQIYNGDIPPLGSLREKSVDLTGYLEILLQGSRYYVPPTKILGQDGVAVSFTIITPSDPERRGAQLSLLFSPEEVMEPVFEGLREQGVIGDERRPGVIRLAPIPMYTRWADCRLVAEALELVLKDLPARLKRLEDEKTDQSLSATANNATDSLLEVEGRLQSTTI